MLSANEHREQVARQGGEEGELLPRLVSARDSLLLSSIQNQMRVKDLRCRVRTFSSQIFVRSPRFIACAGPVKGANAFVRQT